MKINTDHNLFFTYVAKYLGVALIAGSVVHIGTLQNGVSRYAVLIAIGLVLTAVGNIKEAREHGQKINLNYFLTITGLSFATGFLSGGIQHYLDNPSYAGMLLGVGIIVTYVTFFLKDKLQLTKRNVVIVVLLAIVFILFSHFIMDDTLLGAGHHGSESTTSSH
jgi:hypothetical protein